VKVAWELEEVNMKTVLTTNFNRGSAKLFQLDTEEILITCRNREMLKKLEIFYS
jgi:hypothetical protein